MVRVPHYDLEAERALIGAVLIDPLILESLGHVRPEDLYAPEHQAIWRAFEALSGRAFEPVLVRAELEGQGAGEAAMQALTEAEASVLSAKRWEQYAEIVLDRAARRRLAEAGRRIVELASKPAENTAVLLDQAEAALTPAGERRRAKEPVGSAVAVDRALAAIQAQRESGGLTGVTWGLPTLDQRTTGLNPGELWVLAARPGMGKSAFALDVAVAAARSGRTVFLASLEMQVESLAARALCAEAKLHLGKTRGGALTDYEMSEVKRAAREISRLPIWWDDDPDSTVLDIRRKARRIRQRDPNLGLVIVDYLQLLESGEKAEARHLEVAQISRGLKKLAGELGVPVLALSQLSRDVEKGKRAPMLSDLRESGSIEQDADGVIFLHREGEPEPQGELGRVPCFAVVAKARNGPTGWVPITFVSRITTFEDGGHEPEPAGEVVEFHKQAPRRRGWRDRG